MASWAVDWDGTCVEDAWPLMGGWKPGAIEALRTLSLYGTVYIHTCRISKYEFGNWTKRRDPALVRQEINGIRLMLDDEGLQEVEIWDADFKPPVSAYVDNRGVNYNGRPGAWKALIPKLLLLADIDPYDCMTDDA